MIPWLYHRLTARDQAGDLLRIFNFKGERTGADTLISYTVPAERVLLVTSMNWWYFDSAGGTAPQPWLFTITEDTTTVLSWEMVRDAQQTVSVPAGTGASKTLNGSPLLIVPPLHRMDSFIFGGSVAANHMFSFNGILLPHGTFSTGSIPFG